MTDGLVDKGIDEDERDDVPGLGGGRRARIALIGGGVVAALALGGLAIAQPWAGDDGSADGQPSAVTVAIPDGGAEPSELSNRLAPAALPDGFVPTWISDGELDDFMDPDSPISTNVLLVGEGATYAEGPWLGVTVVLLDKFERKEFDPLQYVMAADGQPLMINGLEGIFAKDEFGGDTSELAFGPVNEGYVVTLSSIGLTQAEMVAVATELMLREEDGAAVAWPQFGAKVGELALAPMASYQMPSFGFGGGFQTMPIGGSSPSSTSVNYSNEDGDSLAVSNEVVIPGLDTLAMARFAIAEAKDVTVHDQPAVHGTFDEDFLAGSVVVWEEGGRTMSVFAMGDVDVIAIAESVTELDDQAWADLAAEAEANQDEDFNFDEPAETWLVDAGELDDGTTWLVEGAVDDDGEVTWCFGALQSSSSSTGCESSTSVEVPSLERVGIVGADGDIAPVYVAVVPLDTVGAVLRFTDADGAVVETPLHEVRPEWPFLAAAAAGTEVGTLEIVAADGTVVESLELTEDDITTVFG